MKERIEEGFVKIPNEMILPNEEGKTMIKDINCKVLPIWIYLKNHECKGNCYFSLEDMVAECGYKPDAHKGKINDKFKDILSKMIKEKIIIEINIDPKDKQFKANTFIKCKLMDVKEKFFTLEDYQYKWIMEYKGKEEKLNLLKVFCLIKARMYRRSEDEGIHDGIYEVAFPSYKDIAYNCLISESNIKKYIDILVDLKLIKYDNLGQVIDRVTGEVKECNNTYAIYKHGWQDELEGSMGLLKKKLKEQGYIIPRKERKVDNRSLGGKKTQINKRINNGTAIEKDYIELEQINSQLKKKDEIEELL